MLRDELGDQLLLLLGMQAFHHLLQAQLLLLWHGCCDLIQLLLKTFSVVDAYLVAFFLSLLLVLLHLVCV